jgi:hypothetical protein
MGTIRAMSSREKDSADFDLEAFIDLFDEALASDDPGVQKTLQHLMIIAALARNHAKHDRQNGPLRRMYDDLHNLNRRIDRLETERSRLQPGFGPIPGGGSPLGPYVPSPTTWPGIGGGTTWPPQPGTYPPGTIWAQSGTSGPVAPAPIAGLNSSLATSAVAERIEDLLKSNYKGSSVGTDNVKIT